MSQCKDISLTALLVYETSYLQSVKTPITKVEAEVEDLWQESRPLAVTLEPPVVAIR